LVSNKDSVQNGVEIKELRTVSEGGGGWRERKSANMKE
jgi:hypothetical protein